MSALLKAGDRAAQSAVRRLGAVPLFPVEPTSDRPSPEPERNARRFASIEETASAGTEELDRQCMALEATIADLRHQVQQAEENTAQRIEEAFERGCGEGRELTETSERDRLDAFAASLRRMEREQAERLADCELLALQLARTALTRILGEREAYAELVSAAIERQLAQFKRGLILGVRVSPYDFTDAAGLAELSDTHGGIPVSHDGNLEAGECFLDLKLGQLDLGIPGQWRRLTSYFEELACNEGPE